MKIKILAIICLFTIALSTAPAGQIDPRFEGVWEGLETYNIPNTAHQTGQGSEHMTAIIAIDPAGGAFGVLQGLGTGKYKISESVSHGNKLFFASHLSGRGRTNCTFILSADGNTMTERGFGLLPCKPYACECDITGTFHRKGKT
jgi:hypothetical protein